MGRSNLWSRLAHGSLAIRLLTLLIVLLGMAASLYFSLSQVLDTIQPSVEQRIDAESSQGAHDDAGSRTLVLLQRRPSAKIVAMAKEQLKAEPLNASLLRQLAFAEPVHAPDSGFERLAHLSLAVSRRDGIMQLWLVMKAAKENDGAGLMKHIDILLRTHPQTAPFVFQALRDGIANPQLRSMLQNKIGTNPPWLSDFMIFAIPSTSHPEFVADVLKGFRKLPRSTDLDSAWFQLLQRLADTGHPQELRDVYLRLPQAKPASLQSISLPTDEREVLQAPVAWHLIENSDFAATLISLGRGEGDGLEIFVASGQAGVVARKVVYLTPGTYRFGAVLRPDQGRPNVSFSAECLSSHAALGQIQPRAVTAGRYSMQFNMDKACEAAMINVNVNNDLGQPDGTFVMTDFSLSR